MRNLISEYGLTILEYIVGAMAFMIVYNVLIENSQIISLIEKTIYLL